MFVIYSPVAYSYNDDISGIANLTGPGCKSVNVLNLFDLRKTSNSLDPELSLTQEGDFAKVYFSESL